ncbi:hypothetical protein L2D25_25240 [Salmonella enterica subsp. enterica serovar Muenchen]|uniref:hypothetical protein n=1 Tax=Salmonella enterica TaxID=28901 RepID=UPI001F0F791B|nr:hypothetical protein [Salmonella enterica]EGR7295578.1 hypothetical protein [Salmonella enterica]MCH5444682.1 hypothetical protein [Salmonella enterica subsp. enterica serovar Muenchen]
MIHITYLPAGHKTRILLPVFITGYKNRNIPPVDKYLRRLSTGGALTADRIVPVPAWYFFCLMKHS